MNMRDMMPVLERRLAESRTYQIPPDGFITTLEEEYENYQETRFCERRKRPVYDSRRNLLTYSDMCIEGPGGQARLAEQWGVPLPADYLEFCSIFSEYILAGRAPIQLWSADDVKEDTLSIRAGWDVSDSDPVRLFYFARVVDESADFAFRWSENLDKVEIVYSWDSGDIGEPVLLGSNAGRFVSDIDFTSWLSRMLSTDAHPIFPGERKPTADGWIKQERFPLIRIP